MSGIVYLRLINYLIKKERRIVSKKFGKELENTLFYVLNISIFPFLCLLNSARKGQTRGIFPSQISPRILSEDRVF